MRSAESKTIYLLFVYHKAKSMKVEIRKELRKFETGVCRNKTVCFLIIEEQFSINLKQIYYYLKMYSPAFLFISSNTST